MSLPDQRSLLLGPLLVHALRHESLHLLAIVLVESHIIIANEVIALLAARLGSLAIAILEPSQHTLADMYAAIVDYISLYHLVAIGLHHVGQRPAQEIVAHMPQMQRLVGIRARILNHHQRRIVSHWHETELPVIAYALKHFNPHGRSYRQVQEALDSVKASDYLRTFLHEIPAYLLSRNLRSLPARLEQREDHQRQMTFKLRTSLLQLHHLLGQRGPIQFLNTSQYSLGQNLI